MEVDGEVGFACDDDDACVLLGDVFSPQCCVSYRCYVPFGRFCCTGFCPVFR
jgi:hypothetical protein